MIPFWRGRSMRDRLFGAMTPEWTAAYEAGVFTEFMEQRAPGHTVSDGKIYRRGMRDVIADIDARLRVAQCLPDPDAQAKREQLEAMRICAEAVIRFAERHAERARELAAGTRDAARRKELERIAEVCTGVPAHAPRDFWEALQAYWFVHLGVTQELNTWDAFCPGHLDHHLLPFYERGLQDGSLTRGRAEELLHESEQYMNQAGSPLEELEKSAGKSGSGSRRKQAQRAHTYSSTSAFETTSPYFELISNRFASCGPECLSPKHSLGTMTRNPYCIPSTADARTQPEVEQPVNRIVSTPRLVSVAASEVPKKAEAYC